jgi:hypothetical protein
MTGALSDSVGEFQGTTDPGGIGSENLAANLAEELQMLRFVIKRFLGADQWYEDVGVGAQTDSSNIFTITQAILSTVVNLILNRTENDTAEREIRSVRSGSGVGDKYSERIVGDAANGVATWREYIDEVLAYELTNILSKFLLNVQVGDSILIDEDGHFDLTEISAPATPGANVARLYAKDVSSRTMLAYKDATGNENVIGGITDSVGAGALLAIYQDQKAQNTAGGTFTSGAWQIRTLNTEVYDRDAAFTLSSNQVTLPAGSYEAEWWCPASNVSRHQSRLFDVTNTAVLGLGMVVDTTTSGQDTAGNVSHGVAKFTLADATAIRVENICTVTRSTDGFGPAGNFGTEIYAQLIIRRG